MGSIGSPMCALARQRAWSSRCSLSPLAKTALSSCGGYGQSRAEMGQERVSHLPSYPTSAYSRRYRLLDTALELSLSHGDALQGVLVTRWVLTGGRDVVFRCCVRPEHYAVTSDPHCTRMQGPYGRQLPRYHRSVYGRCGRQGSRRLGSAFPDWYVHRALYNLRILTQLPQSGGTTNVPRTSSSSYHTRKKTRSLSCTVPARSRLPWPSSALRRRSPRFAACL